MEEPFATIDEGFRATVIVAGGPAVRVSGCGDEDDAVASVAVIMSLPSVVELVIVTGHWPAASVVHGAVVLGLRFTGAPPVIERLTESPGTGAPVVASVTVTVPVACDVPLATMLVGENAKLIFAAAAWAVPVSAHPLNIAARSTVQIATLVRFLLIWSIPLFALILFDPAARSSGVQSGLVVPNDSRYRHRRDHALLEHPSGRTAVCLLDSSRFAYAPADPTSSTAFQRNGPIRSISHSDR